MTAITIQTERLDLVLQTPDEVLAFIASLSPEDRAEVSAEWLARLKVTPIGDAWALGFAILDRTSGKRIGSCGFKGPPDGDGMVEIAYAIDQAFQSLGFATEAAKALTEFAFTHGDVRVVRAHTKCGNRASERVLEKSAFQRIGEVIEPDDGWVIRWERTGD